MKKDAGPRPKVIRPEKGTVRRRASLPPLERFEPADAQSALELTSYMETAFQDAANAAATTQGSALSVEDEKLFRAFQSNLLSLISHELRTPLMGVQNAIQAVALELPDSEWVDMAKRNAQRLSRTLQALIDLASIESGNFHARLREMDLFRFVSSQLRALEPRLQERQLHLAVGLQDEQAFRPAPSPEEVDLAPLLGDPAKVGRALELLVMSIAGRAQAGSSVHFRISSARIDIEFELDPKSRQHWEAAWTQAMAAHHSGMISPGSAFGGTVQSEEAFLTRSEEGIGNEFILIHQIMKLHHGTFEAERVDQNRMRISLTMRELNSEEGLLSVLVSRLHEHAPETGALGSVALALIAVPEGESLEPFRKRVKRALYRASDAVYPLHARKQVAIILNDCRAADVPGLLARMTLELGGAPLLCGAVAAPEDGTDPYALLELALKRLRDPSTF